jgi:hypothetical protein
MAVLASRTFVSAQLGNDANACTASAPCRTFAHAVSVTVGAGEVIALDSGGFGPVTITQGLSIIAAPGAYAGITALSGDAITVNAGGSDRVILRGLILNGLDGSGSSGIVFNSGFALYVDDSVIGGFSANGLEMAGAGSLTLTNTTLRENSTGLKIDNSAGAVRASLDHCHIDGNSNGFLSGSASPGASKTTATYCTANNNSSNGWISGASSTGVDVLNLDFCSGSGNLADGLLGNSSNGSSVVRYSNCVFSNNGFFGVDRIGAGTFETRSNNTVTGNSLGATNGTLSSFLPM